MDQLSRGLLIGLTAGLLACSTCRRPQSTAARGDSARPRESEVGSVWTVQGPSGPSTPPANGCRVGRSVNASESACSSDDDCTLTNWGGFCPECLCPFA